MSDTDLLTGLNVEELEALADGLLAPAGQSRLDYLLARRREGPLSQDEKADIDRLLRNSDQLTILKTRARFALNQAKNDPS